MLNALLSADADAVIGAEWGQPSATRLTHRNGYRHRDLETRVGTLDIAVAKLRSAPTSPTGSWNDANEPTPPSSPSPLTCYLAGVSTHRRAPPLRATRGS